MVTTRSRSRSLQAPDETVNGNVKPPQAPRSVKRRRAREDVPEPTESNEHDVNKSLEANGTTVVKVQEDEVIDERPKPAAVKYIPEFQKGLDHCARVDPSLKPVIEGATFKAFIETDEEDSPGCLDYLIRSTVSQQVSGAAARSILKKFQRFFQGEDTPDEDLVMPTTQQILAASLDDLRQCGLSYRKAEYIQGLARAFETGELTDEWLMSASDDDVVDKIVSLKGFGRMYRFERTAAC